MARAIEEAHKAIRRNMRPFGCVIVRNGRVIGAGYGSETNFDPTRHSEMVAIRTASALHSSNLAGSTLYSTHEPCVMCIGAICHAKVSRVVFGSGRLDLPKLFRSRDHSWACLLKDTSCPPEVVPYVRRDECVRLFEFDRG